MNRRTAKQLFAIASRMVLAVSLLFSTGPWALVLASTQAAYCQRMMSAAQHGSASGSHDCCKDAGSDHGVRDCAKHASTCSGICSAVCGLAWPSAVPAAMAFAGLPVIAAAPLPRSGVHAPPLFTSPALRPPIFV